LLEKNDMRQSGQTFKINAYFSSKLKQVEENKDKLLDILNTLSHLKYDRGTREGDFALRALLKELTSEVENHYMAVRGLGGGKSRTTEGLNDYLSINKDRYLDNFQLIEHLNRVKKEIIDQSRRDREFNKNHSDLKYERKKNLFVMDFERDLGDWEKDLFQKAVPFLNAFLSDVNELALCRAMDDLIDLLVSDDGVFAVSGPVYQDFKAGIARFVEMYVKIRKQSLSEKEIRDLAIQTLEEMGFHDIITSSRNVNRLRFNMILDEIMKEYALVGLSGKFVNSASQALKAAEEKEQSLVSGVKEMTETMENLCFLENFPESGPGEREGLPAGLAQNEKERYLFYTPGSFDVSLRYIAEYARDALIYVTDWLVKEIQKSPDLSEALDPVVKSVARVNEFIETYRLSLQAAALRSNQSESRLTSQQRHYISKSMAADLVRLITEMCNGVRQSLVDASHNAAKLAGRGIVLLKKIKIIQDSCNNSFAKIHGGLSKIDRV
jgi:hypothetical protein